MTRSISASLIFVISCLTNVPSALAFGVTSPQTEKLYYEAKQLNHRANRAELNAMPENERQVKLRTNHIASQYILDHGNINSIPPTSQNVKIVAQAAGAKTQREYKVVYRELKKMDDLMEPLRNLMR